MRQYVGLIHKDDASDYGVSFPDLPGAITAGATLEEARELAEQALAFHVEGLIEDGEAVPDPTSLTKVMAEADRRALTPIMVPLGAF
ncbi:MULTISPECIES: type II toxin-antitoxin system HicB family antitoxin [unclassified Mesorhizobium]|uniref:type II toxin-antitoxin system HicB family antitoxin n=1 Tax=unclassified Mesorhizobium TaxID=325217 RepID=UPI00112C136F|nr:MULTISPECIES: type II toxin-antitoxin system HicB family antitoxin [unclassified Mesorhizobium]TPI22175.1 hypothetical protein FJW10_06685 [Mesorhizobium sp. B4-1-1]TPL35979.1 hypothetical protein FJ957_29670 [Mesorhizobium sp. B2-4-6]